MPRTDQDTFENFAAAALIALLGPAWTLSKEEAVKKSFVIADLMMAERKNWDCEGNGDLL